MTKKTIDTSIKISRLHRILSELTLPDDSPSHLLNDKTRERFNTSAVHARNLNPWFTENNIRKSLEGLSYMLREEAVEKWLSAYDLSNKKRRRVGLVLAGNIPMVGFHDILSVIVSGHLPVVKLSSQDKLLLPGIFGIYNETYPEDPFEILWLKDEKLTDIDAVIATGSNNTSRYFEYYFGKYPHIIRKNRSSVAILTGNENEDELKALGEDIFSYFGLGCRNVAKLFMHEDFDLDKFFKSIYDFNQVVNHHKYANNYDYYKALWLMNREELLDNGFLLLRKSEAMSSPVGTLFYERFSSENQVEERLNQEKNQIQCVVSKNAVPFGKSQKPELWDYADGVDTVAFLSDL